MKKESFDTYFKNKNVKKVLFISLYNYQLFSIRLLHSISEKHAEVKTVFFKRYLYNMRDFDIKPSEKEYDLLMNLIKKFEPDMIGISLRSSYFPVAKEITKRI
ncbi:MAG: hypothetical protein KJ674_00805, partial [Nanoarchaeota archaeon]|nr:hypothetical protein [Nanoarchaeota archaeon]